MNINIIAAITKNNVIGKDGTQPWDIPEDWEYFQKVTFGHFVILGRVTNNTMPNAITNKWTKLIISKTLKNIEDGLIFQNIQDALEHCRNKKAENVFILGGQEIFKNTVKYADKIYLTMIDKIISGDKYFPELDLQTWKLITKSEKLINVNNGLVYCFSEWTRLK